MVILKRTSFLLLLCLLLCSCHAGVGTVDFESARLSKPHDRQDDNLKGNVSKVEWTYYGWTGRTYTEDGKIVSLDKYVSKRIIRYSEKGVRISSLRYIAGKFNMLYEYDNDGRIMYHKHEEIINYLIVGGLTTVVSLGVKYILLFTIFQATQHNI